jgi:hypothetical protein
MTEKIIEVMARGICREKCAFMGEPPCFTIMDGSPFTWPPETCCEPGCISEATAAHAALVAAGYVVVDRDTLKDAVEHFSSVTGADDRPGSDSAEYVSTLRDMIEAAEKP